MAPAAHYGMGGIVADLDGATSVPGLYAVGESACTGLHGANRLASNSLSECFVFGARAAVAALAEPARPAGERRPRRRRRLRPPGQHARGPLAPRGLVRDAEGLTALAGDPHPLAALIARHALLREESRAPTPAPTTRRPIRRWTSSTRSPAARAARPRFRALDLSPSTRANARVS